MTAWEPAKQPFRISPINNSLTQSNAIRQNSYSFILYIFLALLVVGRDTEASLTPAQMCTSLRSTSFLELPWQAKVVPIPKAWDPVDR